MFFKVLIVLLCLLSLSLAEIAVEDCAPSYNPWGYTMARTKARNDKKPAFQIFEIGEDTHLAVTEQTFRLFRKMIKIIVTQRDIRVNDYTNIDSQFSYRYWGKKCLDAHNKIGQAIEDLDAQQDICFAIVSDGTDWDMGPSFSKSVRNVKRAFYHLKRNGYQTCVSCYFLPTTDKPEPSDLYEKFCRYFGSSVKYSKGGNAQKQALYIVNDINRTFNSIAR